MVVADRRQVHQASELESRPTPVSFLPLEGVADFRFGSALEFPVPRCGYNLIDPTVRWRKMSGEIRQRIAGARGMAKGPTAVARWQPLGSAARACPVISCLVPFTLHFERSAPVETIAVVMRPSDSGP
ncbi:hypothetical protein [Streptomyces cyanogenus]|uniref:hypothetical protein n=1 Tax=Streptomyces cyanogenus TaxID=80860 RepID=UPI001AA0DD54|nr:hypothetical protein [Streptomyces cyanogenus]